MGSGSTAIAAIREKRNYIGIELQLEYVRLAREACAQENLYLEFSDNQAHGEVPSKEPAQLMLIE